MKRIFLIIITLFFFVQVEAQNRKLKVAERPTKDNERVNEGELKTYVMVLIKIGPSRSQSNEEIERIEKEHKEFLNGMYKEGLLLMTGPFLDDGDVKEILIMNTSEIGEVKLKIEDDPAIQAGYLKAEFHKWQTKSGAIVLP